MKAFDCTSRGNAVGCGVLVGKGGRLFLPIGSYRTFRYGFHFFVWKTYQRWFAIFWWLGSWAGFRRTTDRHLYDDLGFGDILFGGNSHLTAPAASHVAAWRGSPGAQQKNSFVSIDSAGRGIFYCKLACSESADDGVRREAAMLRRLSEIDYVRNHVPTLLGEGASRQGRAYMVTDVAAQFAAARRFGEAHFDFLSYLARHTCIWSDITRGRDFAWMRQHVVRLSNRNSILLSVLVTALSEVEFALSGKSIPLVICHGDFAPWNIRICNGTLYVFDWESAVDESNPIADVCHFHFIQAALRGGEGAVLRRIDLALNGAAELWRRAYPESEFDRVTVGYLMLLYFVRVLVQYLQPGTEFDVDHRVLISYLGVIRRREEWMVVGGMRGRS